TLVYEQAWSGGVMLSEQLVRDTTITAVSELVERGIYATSVSADDTVASVQTNADGSGTLTFESGAVMKFKGVRTLTATAYTAGEPGVDHVTATGTTVHIGVAAVDKRVIPLGTRMYVMAKGVEYGMAVAEDTGVLGESIDLYHNNMADVRQFGRRSATVYILE
ncbi:MAG: 3D domain-containing protein, partial [Oscillibacter sp.]|nr:3D domain-containing protein [Oscillibacter sp.]